MAIMIPSVISPEVKSNAERKIFNWFKTAQGTEDWIVLHSLGITSHNRVIYGEVDFFVLAPNLGLFAFEVKGGRVKRENGIWYFTDKYGETNSKERGPFDQAKEGAFSIVSALKERLDIEHKYLERLFFGYGVMLPDIEYLSGGVDEEQWQVFDVNDGKNVRAFVERVAKGAMLRWKKVYGTNVLSKLPNREDICYLANLLRGDFDCIVSINAQLNSSDAALVSLTKEQFNCLDQLDDNPRCLIQGMAGTGKTLIAIEDVKKSIANGEKVALFCFNSNLGEWLANYFSAIDLSLRPNYVGTLHRFMLNVVKQKNIPVNCPSSIESEQEFYENVLPKSAFDVLKEGAFRFDKIIIDEGQDLISDNYLKVIDACLAKGIARGHWTIFGDFSMQAIYAKKIAAKELLKKIEDVTSFIKFKLNTNCRNTKPICEEIETVVGIPAIQYLQKKIDGMPVQYMTWETMEEQAKRLKNLLYQLHNNHVNPESITILSPKRRENSVVSLFDENLIRNYSASEKLCTTFSTIQAYKGLENKIIILTDIEDYCIDKLLYVGMSRARSGLYILESTKAANEYNKLLVRRLTKCQIKE